MNELSTIRTPEVIASEVMTLTASALVNIIEIGRRFTEAKEILPHGDFGPWLEKLGYKTSTANNFMRLFDAYGSKQNSLFGAEVENFQTFGKLSYSKALALLEVPAEEREEFVETHPVEDMSTRELKEAIRERDEAREALKEAKKDAERWEEKAGEYASDLYTYQVDNIELGKRIKELESRPVDVAVAELDPAEIERRAKEIAEADIKAAVAEAEKKATEEREKLQKKLEKAEAAKKKAEESAANAGSEDKAEAEKLRVEAEEAKSEIERLRKQLAMSDASVTTFKIHFESWQKAHAAMMEALGAVPAETADKLRAAINAAIKGWEDADND